MIRNNSRLSHNAREAFAAYISELEDNYATWYRSATNFNKIAFVVGQAAAILAGIVTAFLAALINEQQFVTLKWLLVLLPLLGASATALLAQTRVRDILALRENGRQQIQALIDEAKASYAAGA